MRTRNQSETNLRSPVCEFVLKSMAETVTFDSPGPLHGANGAVPQSLGSRGYHSSILRDVHTIEPMAGLTPTQKTRLKERTDRMINANRESLARPQVVGSPGSGDSARPLEVSIAGVPLRLKSSHDLETVNELVRMVDDKIRQALPLTKTGSIQNASILAALNMAEELLLLKRRARELVDGLEARAARVIEDMEKSGPPA